MDALCDTRNIALGELPLWMQPHYIADRVDDGVLNQVGAQAWVPQQLIELRCGGSRPNALPHTGREHLEAFLDFYFCRIHGDRKTEITTSSLSCRKYGLDTVPMPRSMCGDI